MKIQILIILILCVVTECTRMRKHSHYHQPVWAAQRNLIANEEDLKYFDPEVLKAATIQPNQYKHQDEESEVDRMARKVLQDEFNWENKELKNGPQIDQEADDLKFELEGKTGRDRIAVLSKNFMKTISEISDSHKNN